MAWYFFFFFFGDSWNLELFCGEMRKLEIGWGYSLRTEDLQKVRHRYFFCLVKKLI